MPPSDPSASLRVPEKIATNPQGRNLYERLGERPGLERLVKCFYAKVRYDPLLGPIFAARITVWSEHLETITDFWVRATGGPSLSAGAMGKHFFLELGPEHFAAWLRVWDQNCRDLLPEAEAADLVALAHHIGDDLQRMIARRGAAAQQAIAPPAPGQ